LENIESSEFRHRSELDTPGSEFRNFGEPRLRRPGHDIDPTDSEAGRNFGEPRPRRPEHDIDPPDSEAGGLIGFTPHPNEPPSMNDDEFLQEAMHLLRMLDIANAIEEGRGVLWPCPTVTYTPIQATPGEEITIEYDAWPDSDARVSFITADGSHISVPASRRGNTLVTSVPNLSVSGKVTIYFERTEEDENQNPHILPRWFPTPIVRGKRFCMDFLGGLSGFRDLTISDPPGDQRCWAIGDEIVLNWVSSNLDSLNVAIAGENFFTDDPHTDVLVITVPNVLAVPTITFIVSTTGPGSSAPDPYILTTTVEIDVMPPDRVSPSTTDELAMRNITSVNNFYFFQSKTQTLPVFRPNTLLEIKNIIRKAEADGITLGILSTGGSYEDITFSELTTSPTAGASSGLIDLAGMVFDVYGHPPYSNRDTTGYEDSYGTFITNFANNVSLTKNVLLGQLRPQSNLPLRKYLFKR